nr:M28 family peptidase [Microvirga antarctica]
MNRTFASMIEDVDGAQLQSHLVEFSRWIKEAGSDGERASLAYVRACLDGFGYSTDLILHDAYISLPREASIEIAGERLACITHSFSQSTLPVGTRGRGIVIGAGAPGDFASTDVQGRIVIVDGIATPPVAMRAAKAGAIGQIHVSPHDHRHEMCISPVWGNPSHETLPNLPVTVVVSVTKTVGEQLKARLMADPDCEISLHAAVDTGWRKTPILVAELPAPAGGMTDPFVMFTGHHDTWHYGVMDNGGANATMIEVARLCALHRDQWLRGLRLIFWSGHSQGRYSSSAWYADTHWEEIHRRAVAHVNIDSTGARGNVVLFDAQADAELVSLAREAVRQHADQDFAGHRVARAGDQSFWGIGVPAIFSSLGEQPASDAPVAAAMLFGGPGRKGAGTGWWWHTPDDTLDKMDVSIAIRDTQIYLHVVWALLSRTVLPLDYAAHVGALQQRLEHDRRLVDGRFDLSPMSARADALKADLDILNHIAAGDVTTEQAAAINACLMAVSRALVPIEHTIGDRFEHDPALAVAAYATLSPLATLAASERGSDAEKFATVALTRAQNRIAWALLQAGDAVRTCLIALDGDTHKGQADAAP